MWSSDKMKGFFSLLLTFGAIFVCNFTIAAAYDDSQSTAVYPYLMFEPAIESIDNLYRTILGLYRSCIIALRKFVSEKLQETRNGNSAATNSVAFGGLYKFKIWREQNYHYTGTLQEMIFYMQREVNEAESNLQIIIKYFSGLADGTIPPPEELSPRVVQIIITIWVELQDIINRLSYDVDVFRSYVTSKIDSLRNRYGEGTFELHAGMKIICHEVDTRSLYWIKIVGPVFRKALALPQASYYIVSLEIFYSEWQTLFALPPEVTVVEILIQCRALANTIHNAAQAYFFLSVSMRLKVDTWPYLNLIFQDSANIKRFVDRAFTRIESYLRSSLNRIQEEIQAESYDQADLEMQNVKEQVERDVRVFIDFTETSYRRINDALYAEYFDIYATDLRYTDSFQNLLRYLVDQGFTINWPENEFSPINERISIVDVSDSSYGQLTHYSKSNFRSIANVNISGNDSKYLQFSLNAYHLILHEKLLLDIISTYQTLLNDLRNTLPQNNASKVILLNLREDAILFAQGFQYLRLYVSQSGLFIDWTYVETVEEYMNLLMKLDLDVLHRIDILCYRVLSTFKRALDYLYLVNSGSQPPTEVTPQAEILVQNTNITPREFTDVPLAENPVVENPVIGNTYPGNGWPHISAPPSFWMGRRLLNRHGKLPHYIRPTAVTSGTPTTAPVIGAEELPTQYMQNEGIVDEILPSSGAELPANIPPIITSLPGIGIPRRIPNDVNVGKKRPILQSSAYRPTQIPIQNPITTGNGIVPEVVIEVPTTVENIPNEEVPISPTQLYVPSARFLNEKLFGKRIKILPRTYHPTIRTPPLVTIPTDVVLEENVINTTEPILPTNNYTSNPSQGGFSSPRSLNEGFFGKRQGIPVSSPQTFTNPPAITNPIEITQGNGENIVEVTTPAEEFIPPSTVLSSSPGGLNGEHFGKIEDIPSSVPQPITSSPSVVIPNQIPPAEEFIPPSTVASSSPGGLNGEHFGKIEDIPSSLPQPTSYSPSVVISDQIPPAEEFIPPSTVASSSPGGLNGEHFGKIEDIPSSLPQPTTYSPSVVISDQIPPAEEFIPPSTVASSSPGGLNGEHFGKMEDIPNSLPQSTAYSPAVVTPGQIPEVNYMNEEPGGEWVPETEHVNGIPEGENVLPTTNEFNSVPEEQFIEPSVSNINEFPEEEYVLPAVNDFNPEQEEEFVQPVADNMNTEPTGELTVENPNQIPDEEFVLPSVNNGVPEEELAPPFQSTNTKPNEEEVAAALDLLSSVFQPLDVNNDGETDLLIINPEEANAGSFEGNGTPQGPNGETTIMLDQNTDGWRESEATLEGTGYFDELGILHDGNASGTQHEEGETNSNSFGLVDFQSDGMIDMAVENSTNQIVNEDSSFVILGDLNPDDGIRTNTVVKTSLTTQEETSMTTYVL